MRKVLPILLAIAIAAPALADVAVSVDDAGDGIARISLAISGDAVVRGVALKVTVTGADISAVEDLTIVDGGFNAYIDYYYSNTGYLGTLADETELPGAVAHALADPDAAGVLDLSAAKSVFSISVGALDNSGAQGGVDTSAVLAEIQLGNFSGDATVCVEPDALRGGIVGDDLGTVVDIDCDTVAEPGEPFPSCQDYNLTKKKNGATDDIVNVSDINAFITYVNSNKIGPFFSIPTSNPAFDADYDFDLNGTVNVSDLNQMIGYVNANKTGPFFAYTCP